MGRRRSLMTVLGVVIIAAAACSGRPIDGDDASAAHQKELVRRWIEQGFNRGDADVVDEVFAERVVLNGQIVHRDVIKQGVQRHRRGFPDLRVTVDAIVSEDATVGLWYTVEGTHGGEYDGIAPTGHHVTWIGADLFTFDAGRISAARFLSDYHGLLTQLGATVPDARSSPRGRDQRSK